MDGLRILHEAQNAGLKFSVLGEKLHIRGPRPTITLEAIIRDNKSAIIEAIISTSHSGDSDETSCGPENHQVSSPPQHDLGNYSKSWFPGDKSRLNCEEGNGSATTDDGIDWMQYIEDGERMRLLGHREYPNPCRYCGMRSRHMLPCPMRFDDDLTTLPTGTYKGRRVDECPTDYLLQMQATHWKDSTEDLRNEARRVIYLRTNFGMTDVPV